MITDVPRTFTKPMWRVLYRLHRIAARESSKVIMDMVIYGTGFYRVSGDGINHVPLDEVVPH